MSRLFGEADVEGPDDIVDAWLRWGLPQIGRWIDHIESRLPDLEDDPDSFCQAEIVFALSSVLNRIAQIHYGTDESLGIREKILPWLDDVVGIPPTEGEALWYGVRNRVIHLGTVNPYGSVKAAHGSPTFTLVEATAVAEYGVAPEFGSIAAVEATELVLGAPVLTGRHLGFATAIIVSDGSIDFRGVASGGRLVRVVFFLDELVLLTRRALDATARYVEENRDRLRAGLRRLHEDVYFSLTEDDADNDGIPRDGRRVILQAVTVATGRKR